jgi:ABC-type bacteriocin/lantibiotic exporter with double-glycine peptidase domain
MVTHNANLTTYASRVITMLDGKIDTDSHDAIAKPEMTKSKRPKLKKTKKKLAIKQKRKKK